MFSRSLNNRSELPFLPPLEAKSADFNFILRQCPATRFSNEAGDRGVLIFGKESKIPGITDRSSFTIHLLHAIFLVRENSAVQLELRNCCVAEGSYFSAKAAVGCTEEVLIERDFDTVILSDPAHRRPKSTYSLAAEGTNHLAETIFHPLPAYPRLLLHHESLGYLCFAFERIGSYPKTTEGAAQMTGIRGFQGWPLHWKEFEVGSTRFTGGGLNNFTIDSELGEFFIPGAVSCGNPTLTLRRGGSLVLKDFDPDYLKDPNDPRFDLDAFLALRSLGFPAEWPPAVILSA